MSKRRKNIFRFIELTPNIHNLKQEDLLNYIALRYNKRYNVILIPGLMYYLSKNYIKNYIFWLNFIKNVLYNVLNSDYGGENFIKQNDLCDLMNWGDDYTKEQLRNW